MKKEKDLLETVLFDFLVDVSRDNMTLRDKTIRDVNDYIKKWIKKHFPFREGNLPENQKDIGF